MPDSVLPQREVECSACNRVEGGSYGKPAEGIRRFETVSSQVSERVGAGKREAEAAGSGALAGETDFEGGGRGKPLSPERRRGAVRHALENCRVSERHACRPPWKWMGTQRYEGISRVVEDELTQAIIALAAE
jgi:hypothetical protein